jgi:hypothetical protein
MRGWIGPSSRETVQTADNSTRQRISLFLGPKGKGESGSSGVEYTVRVNNVTLIDNLWPHRPTHSRLTGCTRVSRVII